MTQKFLKAKGGQCDVPMTVGHGDMVQNKLQSFMGKIRGNAMDAIAKEEMNNIMYGTFPEEPPHMAFGGYSTDGTSQYNPNLNQQNQYNNVVNDMYAQGKEDRQNLFGSAFGLFANKENKYEITQTVNDGPGIPEEGTPHFDIGGTPLGKVVRNPDEGKVVDGKIQAWDRTFEGNNISYKGKGDLKGIDPKEISRIHSTGTAEQRSKLARFFGGKSRVSHYDTDIYFNNHTPAAGPINPNAQYNPAAPAVRPGVPALPAKAIADPVYASKREPRENVAYMQSKDQLLTMPVNLNDGPTPVAEPTLYPKSYRDFEAEQSRPKREMVETIQPRDMQTMPVNIPEYNPGYLASIQTGRPGYFAMGGEGDELNLPKNPNDPYKNNPFTGNPYEVSADPNAIQKDPNQMQGEMNTPGVKNVHTDVRRRNKYQGMDIANTIIAGTNMISSVLEQSDRRGYEKKMGQRMNADAVFTTVDPNMNSRGDYDTNSGIFRPDDLVPTQFRGYSKDGGEHSKYAQGSEHDLTEEEIKHLRNLGYNIEHLD